jgi:hypothetical protein
MPARSASPELSRVSAKVALCLAAAWFFAIGMTACGSTGHNGLSSADAARLHADVAAARTAALRHEAPQAASSLVAFRRQVTRLAAEHKLTTAQAQSLDTGAQQAQARVALDVRSTPAPNTTTPTPAAQPAPAAPPAAGPPGKAKGHDKHKGQGKHGGGPGDGGGG